MGGEPRPEQWRRGEAEAAGERPAPSLWLRVLAGTAGWGWNAWETLSPATPSRKLPRLWYGMVGALAELPPAVKVSFRRGQRTLERLSHRLDRLTERALRLPFAGGLARFGQGWNARAHARYERWVRLGQAVERDGHELTQQLVRRLIDRGAREIAGSSVLQEAIHTASSGLTDTTLEQVRRRGAQADQIAEAMMRRLLRRQPRAMPPHGPSLPEQPKE